MAEGIVYLDVDDEITSAASRIRSAAGTKVALVIPYGSRIATSRINFRLLSREALVSNRRLSVIAGDPAWPSSRRSPSTRPPSQVRSRRLTTTRASSAQKQARLRTRRFQPPQSSRLARNEREERRPAPRQPAPQRPRAGRLPASPPPDRR